MPLATSLCRWFKQACDGRRSHFSDLIERQRGVNDDEAARLLAGQLKEPFANPNVEVEGLAAGSIGLGRRARQSGCGGHVQQERQVWLQTPGRGFVECANEPEVNSTPEPLVRQRGVSEAITHDDIASGEGRVDLLRYVLGAIGLEQKQLGEKRRRIV